MEFALNKILTDSFGRVSAVLAIDKPAGISAHDVVYHARKALKTKKIGHAGALDSFATGLMLILVGKYTKYSDILINKDKSYEADMLLGVASKTQDIEGEIIKVTDIKGVSEQSIVDALASWKGTRLQSVSAYSSVKVKGNKLRVLMRNPEYTSEVVKIADKNYIKLTHLTKQDGGHVIEIPQKEITIFDISLLSTKVAAPPAELNVAEVKPHAKVKHVKFYVHCSKGTYVRQLAEDIGEILNLPAMLYQLRRKSIGSVTIDQAISIDELYKLSS